MVNSSFRRWFTAWMDAPAQFQRIPTRNKAQLALQRLEGREVPSAVNTWVPIGPAPQLNGGGIGNPSVSGRVSSIATDPTNANRYFITSASGGAWRTLDGGAHWVNVTDGPIQVLQPNGMLSDPTVFQTSPFMGAVTIAPSNPNTVYVVTGEYDTGTAGRGLMKSTNGGNSWILIQGPTGPFGSSEFDFSFSPRIVVDRTNENIVFMAVDNGASGNGIWMSTDGGFNWNNITATDPLFTPFTIFSDIQVDPNNPNVVYAAVGDPSGDPFNGIYRTSNALSANPSWTLQIGGSAFVPGTLPGNIKLAISPSQPSTLYAAVARQYDFPGTGKAFYLATYKTTDSGVNWTKLVNAIPYVAEQGDYDMAIVVHPTNPNIVFAGGDGTGFEQSTGLIVGTNNGGLTWRDSVSDMKAPAKLGPHTDIHALAFDKSGRLLVGSDGGMFRLNNATLPAPNFTPPFGNVTPNWVSLNGAAPGSVDPTGGALNTIQFNGIATHPTDPLQVIGGSQDNGVALFNGPVAWNEVLGGDAGYVVWDFDRPENVYRIAPIASVGAANYISKSTDGGLTWGPAASGVNATPGNTNFYPPLFMDPGNSQRLFTGTNAVYATDDGGLSWSTSTAFSKSQNVDIPPTPLTMVNPPIPIDAIAVGRATFQVLYVSQGGSMFRIVLHSPVPMQPTTMEWVDVSPPGSGLISQIVVDPANPSIVYALEGAFSSNLVYRSIDSGASWTVIDGFGADQLPGLPAWSIALDSRILTDPNDDILYVGNDNGMWVLDNPNGGLNSWSRVGDQNLPVMSIHDMDLNATTGVLTAGSYGRGAWQTRIRGLVRGQVFEDINGNGFRDTTEAGQAGITVRVLNATPGAPSFGVELATTVTDANGFYVFPSLRDGDYRVVFSLPNGSVQTSGTPNDLLGFTEQNAVISSLADGLPPGITSASSALMVDSRYNFGFFRLGTISGIKFEDVNGNGVRDVGEGTLSGFRIYIDANGNNKLDAGEQSVVTDAQGKYSFVSSPGILNGVPVPGVPFNLREVQQTGWTQVTPNPIPITPTSGQNVTGIDFGNRMGGGPPPTAVAQRRIVVGSDAGQLPIVNVYDSAGTLKRSFMAYSQAFRGGVRVATADFNGDGELDFVTAPGSSGGPHIRVFDGVTNLVLFEFFAFDPRFSGGVYIAVGDVNGDGHPDIVTGAGPGGGPHVRVFDGATQQPMAGAIGSFFAYGAGFAGGVRVAVGDTNGDGLGDIITGAGPGGGPHVNVFSGADRSVLMSYFAYGAGFRGGVYVTSADMNLDGYADVITGAGEGGGAHVRYVNGRTGMTFNEFFPFPVNTGGLGSNSLWNSGVRVSSINDVNSDGVPDLICGAGPGRPGKIRIISGASNALIREFDSFDPSFLGGVYVGSA